MIHFYLRKAFHLDSEAFRLDLEYAVTRGTFLGIQGPSGSGKSTLLRLLAGLERPDSGYIQCDGDFWYRDKPREFIPAPKRKIGFVFQDYALFPRLTVMGNLLYAKKDEKTARRLLSLTRLEGLERRFPRELSGGQRQRVAIARALARDPELLLLDEPLSALDEDLRAELGAEIRRIQRETGVTAVMVSHSRAEVESLCDERLLLRAGRLVTDGLSVY
jgi:molybdate transport system ATP-binding protein